MELIWGSTFITFNMKFTNLKRAYIRYQPDIKKRSWKLVSEPNPGVGLENLTSNGFSAISNRLVKRIFITAGSIIADGNYFNGNGAPFSYSTNGQFTITIKDIYGRIVFDNLPVTALDLERGKFFTQQYKFIPDFSTSYITLTGSVGVAGTIIFCFDVALNREEKDKRDKTFQKNL